MALTMNLEALRKKCLPWENELNAEIDYATFSNCFKDIYKVTNVPKLRSFQFRLLHRGVITNVHTYHWKKITSDKCTFCHKHRESYLHLFVYCEYVQKHSNTLWKNCDSFMSSQITNVDICFDTNTVITNRIVTTNPYYYKILICLTTNQYIYQKRCFGQIPTFTELKAEINIDKEHCRIHCNKK